jgi:MOSC domain-containing protein
VSATWAEGVLPRVTGLAITPVKGLGMQQRSEVTVTGSGIAGDRAFFLMDTAGKLLSATRTAHFLPYWAEHDHDTGVLTIGRDCTVLLSERTTDGDPVRAHFFADRYATGHVVPGPWSGLLSDIAGRPVHLVRASDPLGGYDVARMSLISEASVDALCHEHGALDVRQFRMTLTVAGVPAFAEDAWVNSCVQVGECVVRVVGPVRRCAAVKRHPEGGGPVTDPLPLIKKVRGVTNGPAGKGLHLGVYAEVEVPGVVTVGDAVRPTSP